MLYPAPLDNVYFHLHLSARADLRYDRDAQNGKTLLTWVVAFVSSLEGPGRWRRLISRM